MRRKTINKTININGMKVKFSIIFKSYNEQTESHPQAHKWCKYTSIGDEHYIWIIDGIEYKVIKRTIVSPNNRPNMFTINVKYYKKDETLISGKGTQKEAINFLLNQNK